MQRVKQSFGLLIMFFFYSSILCFHLQLEYCKLTTNMNMVQKELVQGTLSIVLFKRSCFPLNISVCTCVRERKMSKKRIKDVDVHIVNVSFARVLVRYF